MSTFVLKRKLYAEWGANELKLMREARAAGMTPKQQREWVSMNRTQTGNMTSLTNTGGKTTYGQKANIKTVDKAAQNVTKTQQNIATQQAANQARRTANKANPLAAKQTAMAARTQGYNKGVQAGKNMATVNKTVLKNTWNKMGRGGKIGTVVAGTAAAGLMAKGLFGGKKKENQ